MARFHIYRLKNSEDLIIDLQADLLGQFKTRLVAPLLLAGQFRVVMNRLSPKFTINGTEYFAGIHMISAISATEIGELVLDASGRSDEVTAAINFVFQGF